MEFEYECGNFASSTGKQVSFVRVTNLSDVVKKSVNQLNESGFFVEKSNIPKNLLWVLLMGDKGRKSTKLLLQFLNCKEQHSIHTARLLAIFEGDKDNHQCIQKVLVRYFKSHSSNCDANQSSSAMYSISEFWLSLGGDWEFIARLLGLTGPNGTFFCNFCHAQLKDLEKGKPRTPWLLQRGATA